MPTLAELRHAKRRPAQTGPFSMSLPGGRGTPPAVCGDAPTKRDLQRAPSAKREWRREQLRLPQTDHQPDHDVPEIVSMDRLEFQKPIELERFQYFRPVQPREREICFTEAVPQRPLPGNVCRRFGKLK